MSRDETKYSSEFQIVCTMLKSALELRTPKQQVCLLRTRMQLHLCAYVSDGVLIVMSFLHLGALH